MATLCHLRLNHHNPLTKRRTTIPNHPGVDIPKGTLKAIIKEAGLTVEEFLEL